MKYRRDISSTLKLLALGLILFLGYQVWLKPTYFTPAVPPPSAPEPAPSSSFILPEFQEHPQWDVPPSRLVDLGSPPNQALGAIREELDRGNYTEAERRLKQLSPKSIAQVASRLYIAGLWNNLGIQQEKFGGTSLSVKAFKQSVLWDAKNSIAHLNLTQACWELRDPAMTPQFLETVIRLAPQDPFPHLALADLLIATGQAGQATAHVDQARPRAERDPNHHSYLQRLTAKLETLEPVQVATRDAARPPQATPAPITQSPNPQPTQRPAPALEPARQSGTSEVARPQAPPPAPAQSDSAHFTVQFDGPPDQASWTRMRAILEYAHDELSQKLGRNPSKPITVVLHTNQKFTGTAGSPVWADSLFDRAEGTIHIPTQGALEDLALFSRIARHECVHALLFEQAKGSSAKVPHWIVEGLALQLAEDPWPDLEEAEHKTSALIPLNTLQGDWKPLSSDTAPKAYLEARSATQLLVDSYGLQGVQQVMKLMQAGQSLDAAMQQKLSVSYEQFRKQWEQAMNQPNPGSL
ncbi:MAG: tetratricopeptide repeat protein [Nitrospira sp.]